MLKLKKILLVLVLLMVLLFVKQPTIVEATPLTDSVTIEYHIAPVGFDDLGYATESGIKDDEIDIVSIFRTTT